jgi:hypothetical protein
VKIKLGPKTFTMPSAQIPQFKLPQLKLLTAVRIPIPKAFKVGGGRAALMSVLVVAGGFGASFALIINTVGGDATIGEILIDDVDASVGAWKWEGINAGCIVMENTNQFGNGTGINVASAVFNDTVKARVITDNLVDTPISVK